MGSREWTRYLATNPRGLAPSLVLYLAELARREQTIPRAARPKCGARTRAGSPCKAPVVWDEEKNQPKNGRCKLHGGLSTGPKTKEGRRRVAEVARQRMRARWGTVPRLSVSS